MLEVSIYKDRILLADKQTGPIKIIRNKVNIPQRNEGNNTLAPYDFVALKKVLMIVKNKFPDITDVTILLEEDTPYDLLIKTMDTVRLYSVTKEGETIHNELFPDIAIGNAPLDSPSMRTETRPDTNTDAGVTTVQASLPKGALI